MTERFTNCLLCDNIVLDDCKYPIFQSFAPHSGILLVDLFVKLTPRNSFEPNCAFLCKLCYALLERFDYFEFSTSELRRQILTQIEAKFEIENSISPKFVDASSQTDDILHAIKEDLIEECIKVEKTEVAPNTEHVSYDDKKLSIYCCKLCNDRFKKSADLKKHLKTHSDIKTFECKYCQNIYTSKSGLLGHVSRKHKATQNEVVDGMIEPSDVLECNIKIENPELENEIRAHADTGSYDVNEDADSVSSAEEFFATSKLHELSKRHSNNGSNHMLHLHTNSSSEDSKPLKFRRDAIKSETLVADSDSVDSQHADSDNFRPRKRRGRPRKSLAPDVINIKPYIFQCPQCPKKWRTKSELRIHLVSHSDVRAHVCDICGQAYKKRAALDIHLGMHNGVNPYTCNTCGKVFTQKGALNRHLPIHTGEANYQCDLCGKRFIHHTSFSMHALTHSGLKAYKCEICGLGLMSTSHLKRHMRAHSGEKKYGCSQCGKRFAERYNLAAHERLHFSPEGGRKRSHPCPLCGDTFQRRQKLEEHLTNNHNKILDTDETRKWTGAMLNGENPWATFPSNLSDNAQESTST